MKRLELTWMVFAQFIHLASLWTWARILDILRETSVGPAEAKAIWPTFVILLALIYPILLLSCSGAAWVKYAKRETNLALMLISLPLFLSLPVVTYGFVMFMALR